MLSFFFFNDTATSEIYTLSLHDALPIFQPFLAFNRAFEVLWAGSYMNMKYPERLESAFPSYRRGQTSPGSLWMRSEEHTSELQSQFHLVCRLLLEKKKKKKKIKKTNQIQ